MEPTRSILVGVVSMVIIALFFLCKPKLNHLRQHGYLGIFLGCFLGNIAGPSSFLSTLIGGRYLNPWLVGLVGALGAIMGEVLNYNAGTLGQFAIKDQSWFETVHRHVEEKGFSMIIVLTAIPNPVMNVAALVSGALHYPLLQFVLASFIGNWLQFFLTAEVGGLSRRIL